MAVGLL